MEEGLHRLLQHRIADLFSRVFFTFFFVSMNSHELKRAVGSREPVADGRIDCALSGWTESPRLSFLPLQLFLSRLARQGHESGQRTAPEVPKLLRNPERFYGNPKCAAGPTGGPAPS